MPKKSLLKTGNALHFGFYRIEKRTHRDAKPDDANIKKLEVRELEIRA
jgi:hypothetical protein